jgi:hypothetical protein
MKKPFKHNDRVCYSVVPGTILGIYNTSKALFLSDYPKDNFLTFSELRTAERRHSDVFIFFVREQFGNVLSERAKKTLKQRRFFPVLLSELKHLDTPTAPKPDSKTPLESLVNKRHLLLTMAKHYVRSSMSDEKIHRVCERVEDLQLEIESLSYNDPRNIRDNSQRV